MSRRHRKTRQAAFAEPPRKNLPAAATALIANARNDITIPFFSGVLQNSDDTLIQQGGGKGLKIYDEIERDTHAGAMLEKRKGALISREWAVEAGGDRPIDKAAADLVRDMIGALPFDQICRDLLDATLKGYAVSEVVWGRDGIMGNVSGESSFNPLAGGDDKNGVPTSFGLFQHHGPRADGLLAALGGRQNLGNVQGQLDYAWRELNTTHSGALAALKAAPDVSSATNAWMRQFERPSDEAMQKSWANRLGAAEQAMAKFGATTTLATGQLGTMGTGFDKFGQALGSAVQGGGGGGFWGTLFSGIMSGLGIPGFAGGGQHGGGLRIVGETGPELEYTGPSTIVPADLTRRILSGGAPSASTTQIDARPVINITNNSSVPVQGEVQETTDSRGQRRFELVMADAVASGLTAGGGRARRTMRDYYGVNPVGIAR